MAFAEFDLPRHGDLVQIAPPIEEGPEVAIPLLNFLTAVVGKEVDDVVTGKIAQGCLGHENPRAACHSRRVTSRRWTLLSYFQAVGRLRVSGKPSCSPR
jgi:hypothetical protein